MPCRRLGFVTDSLSMLGSIGIERLIPTVGGVNRIRAQTRAVSDACCNFCNNIVKFASFSHVPTLGCAAAPPGPGPGRPGHRATAEDAPQRLRVVLSLFLLLQVALCCYCCCRSHVTNQNLLLREHFRRMLELALLARACPFASALPHVACRMHPLASPPPRLRPRAPPAALERGPFCACSRRPHMRRAQLA